MAQESRSVAGFDSEADLRRVTENPHHHVHTVRARVRARVQRLCDDERGIRRSKEIWGEILLVPTAEAARDCLSRRRIDDVFVNLEVPGALAVMEAIRKGTSNSKAVIFACVTDAKEYTDTLSAGANFLLRKPLHQNSVALHITIAKELLERERRRYFRHAVNLPLVLKDSVGE